MSCVLFSHIVSSLFYAFLQDAGTTAAINHAIPRPTNADADPRKLFDDFHSESLVILYRS